MNIYLNNVLSLNVSYYYINEKTFLRLVRKTVIVAVVQVSIRDYVTIEEDSYSNNSILDPDNYKVKENHKNGITINSFSDNKIDSVAIEGIEGIKVSLFMSFPYKVGKAILVIYF